MAANRKNAQKSTGPRTAAGKARSRRNACRHGFAARALAAKSADGQVDRIVQALCREGCDPRLREQAVIIADAQRVICRIRMARAARGDGLAGDAGMIARTLILDRYERRALLRRRRAVARYRAIVELSVACTAGKAAERRAHRPDHGRAMGDVQPAVRFGRTNPNVPAPRDHRAARSLSREAREGWGGGLLTLRCANSPSCLARPWPPPQPGALRRAFCRKNAMGSIAMILPRARRKRGEGSAMRAALSAKIGGLTPPSRPPAPAACPSRRSRPRKPRRRAARSPRRRRARRSACRAAGRSWRSRSGSPAPDCRSR